MHKLSFDGIARLLYKYKTGTLVQENEIEMLYHWRASSVQNEALFKKVGSAEGFMDFSEQIESIDVDRGWRSLQRKIQKPKRRNIQGAFLKYAAMVAILSGISAGGYWLCTSGGSSERSTHGVAAMQSSDIVPGKNKAILTLPSGEQIELEEEKTLSAKQIAEYAQQPPVAATQAKSYSTIETLVGGEYRLELSDGSLVYLNSQTTLRFPDTFTKDKREIELLEGEIYVDVRSVMGYPFFVKAKEMMVCVTGTCFNISVYDNINQTTLVKGAVEVVVDSGESYTLNPSEQLSFESGSNNVKIRQVDTDLYTSWIEGRIVFRDETIENIMKKLSRWYNFHVEYDDPVLKERRFGIHVDKYDHIEPLLKLLESTGKLAFEVTGNTIRITKSNAP